MGPWRSSSLAETPHLTPTSSAVDVTLMTNAATPPAAAGLL